MMVLSIPPRNNNLPGFKEISWSAFTSRLKRFSATVLIPCELTARVNVRRGSLPGLFTAWNFQFKLEFRTVSLASAKATKSLLLALTGFPVNTTIANLAAYANPSVAYYRMHACHSPLLRGLRSDNPGFRCTVSYAIASPRSQLKVAYWHRPVYPSRLNLSFFPNRIHAIILLKRSRKLDLGSTLSRYLRTTEVDPDVVYGEAYASVARFPG